MFSFQSTLHKIYPENIKLHQMLTGGKFFCIEISDSNMKISHFSWAYQKLNEILFPVILY